jgi:serine protease AprX
VPRVDRNRIIKVFVDEAEQAPLARELDVIEGYDGFLLARVTAARAKKLAKQYLVQDVTNLYSIPLARGKIDTSVPRIDSEGRTHAHPAYPRGTRLGKGPHHYLVQFIGPIKEKWLMGVRRAGGQPCDLYSDFAYVVRANRHSLPRIVSRPYVRWVGHLPHEDRLSTPIRTGIEGEPPPAPPRMKIRPHVYVIEFFTVEGARKAVPEVRRLGLEVLAEEARGRILVVKTLRQKKGRDRQLKALAAVHGVRKIRERFVSRPANDVATRILATEYSMGNPGLGLSGRGEVVAVCDTGLDSGDPDAIHPDFRGRVVSIWSYPITPDFRSDEIRNPGADDGPADLDSGHGTHVAGSAVGNGSASVGVREVPRRIAGCAYRAKIVFQAVEQALEWRLHSDLIREGRYLLAGIPLDLKQLFRDAHGDGARIHSNSWNGGRPGTYDQQCYQLDEFVWQHDDFCVLFAAGNDGADRDRAGTISPKSIAPPATAKNCITVGACENRRPAFKDERWGSWWPKDFPVAPFKDDPMANSANQLAAFSSRGPTNTGRSKPDVVAPGTFVLSTRSAMIAWENKGWAFFRPKHAMYFYLGGTSMATPLVAGVVALLREYLRKNGIAKPTAALLKAALIAGARRLPGYGEPGAVVDNDQGYGRVDLDAVLAPPAPASTRFLEISPGLRAGEVHGEELRVRSGRRPLRIVLAYTDRPGRALVHDLNLIVSSPDGRKYCGNQRTRARIATPDTHNNTEVVHIARPAAGIWNVEVVASNVPTGRQGFALVSIGHF